MPKSLLLADDSVTIQKVVGISFANEDIEITTVDNGRDAVAKARAIRPDIILADVVMPGMSGYEVCETIKADPNLRHVPVLLLTGTFEAFDQARANAVGAAGHVAKPFEAQTLVDRVKQLLAAAPAAAKAATPARPAAAPAPAPVSPAMGDDDDAFDFFSDAPQPPAATPPPVPSGDALDFDDPDGAFAFGEDDLAADLPGPGSMPTAAPIRRPDATIAMLPDPPSASEEAFDFSFESAGGGDAFDAPMEADQLAHTTLLDPAAGSGFDVSSSDLEVSRAPAAATQILSLDDAEDADPLTEPDSVFAGPASFAQRAQVSRSEPKASEAHQVGERRPAGARAPAFDDEDPFEATVPPFRAPRREAAFDSFDSDPLEDSPIEVGEPLRAGEELDVDDPFASEPELAEPAVAEPEPWEEATFDAPAAEGPMPAGAPGLERAELHDMIEKIAWDAFAPVTEKIVREVIARIEQVAWEVVPKLAETLIQEEIRKLKGGS